MKLYKQTWDNVYKKRFMTLWSPSECVVKFVGRFLKKRLTLDTWQELFPCKKILDIGCGNGATAVFLAKQYYEVYAIDISTPAIALAKRLANHEQMNIHFTNGDAANLPYDNNFFDAIVSHAAIDHMEPEIGQKTVNEAHRTLRDGGLFFLSLIDKRSKKFGEGKKAAHNTFVLEGDQYEAGAVQHYFSQDDIKKLLGDKFRIVDIYLASQRRLTPDFEPNDWNFRWFITAKKSTSPPSTHQERP